MSVVDDLKVQIAAGRITFDVVPTLPDKFRKDLLGENAGPVKVTSKLQKLALELSLLQSIKISSVIRNEGHHGLGRAFDVGNEAVAEALLSVVGNAGKVAALGIDELIFDASVANSSYDRNRWNFDAGNKHNYSANDLGRHDDHIHFSVKP